MTRCRTRSAGMSTCLRSDPTSVASNHDLRLIGPRPPAPAFLPGSDGEGQPATLEHGPDPPGKLTARHVDPLDALVTRWHGQRVTRASSASTCRAVSLPGGHPASI